MKWTLVALGLCLPIGLMGWVDRAIAQVNSQPVIETMADGNYALCSIPDEPEDARTLNYMQLNDAICYWFSKQGNRVAGVLSSASANNTDFVCVEGEVQGSQITGRAINVLPRGAEGLMRTPEGAPNAVTSYWLSKDKKVLLLHQGLYYNAKPYPYILFSRARLDLTGFYRYWVGSRMPPKTCTPTWLR